MQQCQQFVMEWSVHRCGCTKGNGARRLLSQCGCLVDNAQDSGDRAKSGTGCIMEEWYFLAICLFFWVYQQMQTQEMKDGGQEIALVISNSPAWKNSKSAAMNVTGGWGG